MALIASWVISESIPSEEAVRLRNALLAKVGTEQEFKWFPDQIPDSFLQERLPPSPALTAVNEHIFNEINNLSNFDKALHIARNLLQADHSEGGAIMAETLTAYKRITEQGVGYCADYTQVFNGLAHAAGLPVREWGMAFDGFGGWGHAINEIYDDQYSKWVFIDTFNAFYVQDCSTSEPISFIEFRDSLADGNRNIELVKIVERRFGFKDEQAAFEYFRRGKDQIYLWWGNNVFTYENNPIVKICAPVSRHLEQLVAIIVGIHPGIRIMQTEGNSHLIKKIMLLKKRLLFSLVAEVLLLVFLLAQVWKIWRKYNSKH